MIDAQPHLCLQGKTAGHWVTMCLCLPCIRTTEKVQLDTGLSPRGAHVTMNANVCANAQRQTRHHATTNGASKGRENKMQNLEGRRNREGCYAASIHLGEYQYRLRDININSGVKSGLQSQCGHLLATIHWASYLLTSHSEPLVSHL